MGLKAYHLNTTTPTRWDFERHQMRGSVKWQVTQLVKLIFEKELSKTKRRDEEDDKYNFVTQNTTMQTYKLLWIEFATYAKKYFDVKDVENLSNKHVEAFMNHKVNSHISKQTIEKISSALGKLEFALTYFSKINGDGKVYDFNYRTKVLNFAREFELVYDGYHGRAYVNPQKIINELADPMFKLAAKLQLEGGARVGGIDYIPREVKISHEKLIVNKLEDIRVICIENKKAIVYSLQGIAFDKHLFAKGVKKKVGQILTVEKGGKPGLISVSIASYKSLERIMDDLGEFSINRFAYMCAINKACHKLGFDSEGSHGFRWTHVQNRQQELVEAGYLTDEAMLINSHEHKHWRKEITGHYLS